MEWRPISTAPKDAPVLVFNPHHNRGVQIARTRDGESWWTLPGTYQCRPTHWMPLPNPPQKQPDTVRPMTQTEIRALHGPDCDCYACDNGGYWAAVHRGSQ